MTRMPDDVHAITFTGDMFGGSHRLSRHCECQPVAAFDISAPSRMVWLHGVIIGPVESGQTSRSRVRVAVTARPGRITT